MTDDKASKDEFVARILDELRRGGTWNRSDLVLLLESYFLKEQQDRLDTVYLCMAQARMKALKWCLDVINTSNQKNVPKSYAASAIQTQIDDLRDVIHSRIKDMKRSVASYGAWSDEMSRSFVDWQANTVEPNIHFANQTFDENLLPYIQRIMQEMPHVASAHLSDLSALTDFCPSDKEMDEWITQMSKRLGIQIERSESLLTDLARKLQAKESSLSAKKQN